MTQGEGLDNSTLITEPFFSLLLSKARYPPGFFFWWTIGSRLAVDW